MCLQTTISGDFVVRDICQVLTVNIFTVYLCTGRPATKNTLIQQCSCENCSALEVGRVLLLNNMNNNINSFYWLKFEVFSLTFTIILHGRNVIQSFLIKSCKGQLEVQRAWHHLIATLSCLNGKLMTT